MRELIDRAKDQPCSDCKQEYPLCVMQFDHVRGKKKFGIASATAKATSLKSLQEEIDKCEVVCANCHAIRTDARLEGRWKVSHRKT